MLGASHTRFAGTLRCLQYEDLLGCIDRMSMEELVMAVRRQSQGFSRGTSNFRGVTHHPSGERHIPYTLMAGVNAALL